MKQWPAILACGAAAALWTGAAAAETPLGGGGWDGAYFGGQLGTGNLTDGGTGGTGGLFVGIQRDRGTWILGAQADAVAADLAAPGGDRLDRLIRLQAKAGVDHGRVLIYGTAGLAYGWGETASGDAGAAGWTAGLGADYRLNDRTALGGRAVYQDLGRFDGGGGDLRATTLEAVVSFRF
jgi:opacity protein-like surface antigen